MIHSCSSRSGTARKALRGLCLYRRRYSSTSTTSFSSSSSAHISRNNNNNDDEITSSIRCGASRIQSSSNSSSSALDEPTIIRVVGKFKKSSASIRSLSTTTTTTTTTIQSPTIAMAAWTERFDECIRQGELAEAQSLLFDFHVVVADAAINDEDTNEVSSSSSSSRSSDEAIIVVCRGRLLDAWICRQRELLDELYDVENDFGVDDHENADRHKEEEENIKTRAIVSLRILQDIREAAESAHSLLEQVAPFLGQRMHLLESLVLISEQQQQEKTDKHLEEPENDDGGSDAVADLGSTLSYDDAALRHQLHHSPSSSFDAVLSQRCDAVLEAWANVVRAYWHYNNSNNNNNNNNPRTPGTAATTPRWTRGVPQRAQFLLEQMERRNATTNSNQLVGGNSGNSENIRAENSVRPTVESYNHVIEAWAFSNEHLRGAMAERVFQSLRAQPKSSLLRSNGESYRHIIWAWALSRDRRAAFTATGHLMKMLRKLEKGDEDMEPTLEDYTVLLKAWTRAEDKMSPGKASSVLRLMEYAHSEAGVTDVRPDMTCYKYVLETAARRPQLPDLGVMVDSILAKMDEQLIVPDSVCYSAALRTWKNSALNPDMYDYRERSVRRTLELLETMNVARQQSLSSEVQVSTDNINDVIESLAVSSNPKRMGQAEALLESMEKSVGVDKGEDVTFVEATPNAHSYRLVFDVWRTSNSIEKVPKTMAILWRMKENYESFLKSVSKPGDIVEIFNAFVRVCGSAHPRNEKEGTKIFREALEGIEGMRSMDVRGQIKPNATSYAALLEACRTLLPVGKERYRVVEQVFRLSCEEGMVDDNVICELRLAATEEQYSKLVIVMSEVVEGTKMVPEAWTRNALGGRVVTADGRRTKPLSIDGEITVTNAMREFQMRRIRDKRNRNLLQGGRLRNRAAATKSNLTSDS